MKKNENSALPILILGLGKTGLSCANFLNSNNIAFRMMDNRLEPPCLQSYLASFNEEDLILNKFDTSFLKQTETIVISPGISLNEPFILEAKKLGIEIIGDIELFARYANAPVVAVTGSNGKSTVTTLIHEMFIASGLDAKAGGNLGTPALDLISPIPPAAYILEISSFQLDSTGCLPTEVSVVLNISEDHMDRYENLTRYKESKAKVYDHAKFCVVNKDDCHVVSMVEEKKSVIKFSASKPTSNHEYGLVCENGITKLMHGNNVLINESDLYVKGKHNFLNILAAFAICNVMGCKHDAMIDVARKFKGLPHRCEWVLEHEGVSWFNDSKATNVGAALAAIEGMSDDIILIAGGDSKGADLSPLKKAVSEKTKAVILIGRDAHLFENAFQNCVPVVRKNTMQEAVSEAKNISVKGDCVLLAPACASLDMYANYEARGNDYINAIHEVYKP